MVLYPSIVTEKFSDILEIQQILKRECTTGVPEVLPAMAE
jgi:hypothetical protein